MKSQKIVTAKLIFLCIVTILFLSGCFKTKPLQNDFSLEVERKRILLIAERDDFNYTNNGPPIQNVHMKITYWETEGNFGSKGGTRVCKEYFDEWKSNECKTIQPIDTVVGRISKIVIEIKAKEGVLKKEFTKGSFRIINSR